MSETVSTDLSDYLHYYQDIRMKIGDIEIDFSKGGNERLVEVAIDNTEINLNAIVGISFNEYGIDILVTIGEEEAANYHVPMELIDDLYTKNKIRLRALK